jgi:D-amino-acid dehydrogenase
MKCLDDPSDVLVQGIEYDRWAIGTKALDGTVHDNGDSSGDIDMFCRGLLHKLMEEYDDVFEVIPGEEATMLRVDGGGVLRGVATIDRNGERRTHEADKIVVALGANSSSLCGDIGVSCPVYPARGHLVTVASKFDHRCNLTLDGGLGYAAPMARVDHLGRRMYRLSGFVDFAPPAAAGGDGADPGRIDALVGAARSQLPDLEVVDASACHRPISADDRALVGPSGDEHPDLYLATGFGSRGWTIGLGSGKLLASMMMGVPCDIDPTPYLPSRFSLSYKGIFGTRRRAAPLM